MMWEGTRPAVCFALAACFAACGGSSTARPPREDKIMLQERTELNRHAIRRAFEGWQQGTVNIADTFAPEMVWRIEGRSVASRIPDEEGVRRRGPRAVRRPLRRFERALPTRSHPRGLRGRRRGRGPLGRTWHRSRRRPYKTATPGSW